MKWKGCAPKNEKDIIVSFSRFKFGNKGYRSKTLLKTLSLINSHFKFQGFHVFYWKILIFQGFQDYLVWFPGFQEGFQCYLVWFPGFQGFQGPTATLLIRQNFEGLEISFLITLAKLTEKLILYTNIWKYQENCACFW